MCLADRLAPVQERGVLGEWGQVHAGEVSSDDAATKRSVELLQVPALWRRPPQVHWYIPFLCFLACKSLRKGGRGMGGLLEPIRSNNNLVVFFRCQMCWRFMYLHLFGVSLATLQRYDITLQSLAITLQSLATTIQKICNHCKDSHSQCKDSQSQC